MKIKKMLKNDKSNLRTNKYNYINLWYRQNKKNKQNQKLFLCKKT